jgi:integrase
MAHAQPARRDPHIHGSRLSRSARGEIAADLRWLGLGQRLLRDPSAPGWTPDGTVGDPTRSEVVARGWERAYLVAVQGATVRRQLGVPDAVQRTLAAEMDAYLDRMHARRAERSTIYGMQGVLRILLDTFGPDRDPRTYTPEEIQALLAQRVRAGYATSTLKVGFGLIRQFLKHLGSPAADNLELPREERRRVKAWDAAGRAAMREAAAWVEEHERHHYPFSPVLALELALASGAREGELFALRWENIDASRRGIWVEQQADRYDRNLRATKSKSDRFALLLPSWWTHHVPGRTGIILAAEDGGPVVRGRGRKVILRIMEVAGLKREGQGNHMTRHTYAREFLETCGESGVNGLPLLKEFLGHSSVATTEGYYGHYAVELVIDHAVRALYAQGRALSAA